MDKCNCSVMPVAMTVGTVDGLKSLANVVVRVLSNNTVYHISACHEITVLSSGPVFVDEYDVEKNPLNLRGQVCYDFAAGHAIVYNDLGEYRVIKLEVL